MNKLILSFLFVVATGTISAQDAAQDLTCLDKYKKVFKERGANHVSDGMHREVIVSVKDEYGTNCFYGKARVEGSKVTAIFIKFRDETYELFESDDFRSNFGAGIKNGISDPWVTKDDRAMNVVFVKNIKPKKKEYMKAPDPDPDKL